MSLRDEMTLYTELTGEDGTKVPIGQLGHFLWEYEIGIEKGRPKGKWNHYTDDRNDYVECSECHYGDEGEVELGYPQKMGWKFCPNCGAEMRGEI